MLQWPEGSDTSVRNFFGEHTSFSNMPCSGSTGWWTCGWSFGKSNSNSCWLESHKRWCSNTKKRQSSWDENILSASLLFCSEEDVCNYRLHTPRQHRHNLHCHSERCARDTEAHGKTFQSIIFSGRYELLCFLVAITASSNCFTVFDLGTFSFMQSLHEGHRLNA